MSWRDIVRKEEKMHCGGNREKADVKDDEPFEKKKQKPDYIDLDGDGNKTESMRQAAKDKKKKGRSAFTSKD